MSDWISVKVQLPQIETPVLIRVIQKHSCGLCDRTPRAELGRLFSDGDWYASCRGEVQVTHWMPIPEFPI